MGFVPSSSTIQLYAYFTEYAREKIFNGDIIDFKVTEFSLHDDDVNYLITSNSNGTTNQPLTSGFLPDITGDIDSCIKSNKTSIVFGRNMLTGTTQVSTPVVFGCTNSNATNYNPLATVDDGSCIIPPSPPQTRTLTIGFDTASYTDPTIGIGKNFSYSFNIFIKALVGDTTGNATLEESLATTFNIEIVDYDSALVENIRTTPLNPKGFSLGNTVSISLQFGRVAKIIPVGDVLIETTSIKLRIVPLQSNRILESGKEFFTYTKTLKWGQ
jgi:hypothetical protein